MEWQGTWEEVGVSERGGAGDGNWPGRGVVKNQVGLVVSRVQRVWGGGTGSGKGWAEGVRTMAGEEEGEVGEMEGGIGKCERGM